MQAPGPLLGDRLGRFAMLVVAGVVVLSVVRALLPMEQLDYIWRPADTATIAHNFFVGGMNLFYPQINWGGAGPGYVEMELPLLPWLAAALYFVVGEHAWVGRLVALAFMVASIAAFWGLARRVLPAKPARWSLTAFVVSPVVMTYGNAYMPDTVVLAFYVLTLLFFQRWLTEDRTVWLVAAAAAASAAALAKPTSLHVFLILLIWLLIAARDRLRRPSLYVAGVLALIPPALWLLHGRNLYVEYGNTFGVASGGDSKFGNLEVWTSAGFWTGNFSIESTLIYGVVGVPLALLGAWLAWKGRGPVVLAAGLPALFVFYVAVGRYSAEFGPQYHIFSLPFAAIMVALGVVGIDQWLRGRVGKPLRLVLAVAVTALLFAMSANVLRTAFQDQSSSAVGCAAQLAAVSAPTDLVVIASDENAYINGTANNFEDPTIFYLAGRKGWALGADQTLPSFLEEYTRDGARYLVVNNPDLVPAGGPLASWLDSNAQQVSPTAGEGCTIWALSPR
ncbi:glycosyltransferase family 39 protein [Actinomycetes bacterium KLBMP 9759]